MDYEWSISYVFFQMTVLMYAVHVIYFTYFMCENLSLKKNISKCGLNKIGNDEFVISLLYSMVGIEISRRNIFCPSTYF